MRARCYDRPIRPRPAETANAQFVAACSWVDACFRRRFGAQDFVGAGVTIDYEPALAARTMIPKLAMRPYRIVTDINVLDKAVECVGGVGVGPLHGSVTKIREFVEIARAA